jgi:hypothetical protein
MSDHTPAPWRNSGPAGHGTLVSGSNGHAIAVTYSARVNPRSVDDTSLLIAAPDMYVALKAGRQKLATYVGVYKGDKELLALLGQWDAALDRAEGLR